MGLIDAQFSAASPTLYYTVTTGHRVIIDKMTATNTDSSAITFSVYLVPAAGSQGASNAIVSSYSIAAGATFDASVLQNHILNSGDKVYCGASSASKIVIRMSGRDIG